MGEVVTLPVADRDIAHVAPAMARVRQFWPELSVRGDGHAVALASERYASDRMCQIWICALLNERLVNEAAVDRAQILSDLLA